MLVTSALPYASGPIHLGHLLEHVQTDIWVRFQRLAGHECIYVCAEDAHGTATMLRAEAEGATPEALAEQARREHSAGFAAFHIAHDNFHITHSPENRRYSELIYERLRDKGCIFTQAVEQLFDEEKGLFLADRYVRGTCPRCGAPDQYGDNCEACGATYEATELVAPRSELSGTKPTLRSSDHHFFDLPRFTDFLKGWTTGGGVQPEVANKLAEWLGQGLKAWDISRDGPYFGFEIPDAQGKYFYVWMDAPIGYMASFRNYCDREGLNFDEFWRPDSPCEVHHFIGKDIVNFHALFWPAVLHGAGFRPPTRVHTHGFVTVAGAKMSKSRGTFVTAAAYLEHLDPEHLRYYYATKLSPNTDDIDINPEDFAQRVNSDLVGKIVNIASRCAGFLHKGFDATLAPTLHDVELWQAASGAAPGLAALFDAGDFARAMREVAAIADRANQYINDHAPWRLAREAGREAEVHGVCSLGINVFRALVVYLKPVLPAFAARAEAFLNVAPLTWQDAATPLFNHRIEKFSPLAQRMDQKAIKRMFGDTGLTGDDHAVERREAAPGASAAAPAPAAGVSVEDFQKIDLRVARIEAAELVDGADKLLRLTLDLGDSRREVLSGIRAAYTPESLVGRHAVVVANLAPRKMRFGTSEGMVLAAGPGGSEIFLVTPDAGARPGMEVR